MKPNQILKFVMLFVFIISAHLFADSELEKIIKMSQLIYTCDGIIVCKFHQLVSTGDFFDDEETSGKLVMYYPDKFRITTPEQTFCSDGIKLWSYSVENKQVTIDKLDKLEGFVTPGDYFYNYSTNYQIEYDSLLVINKHETHRLKLTAKAEDDYVQDMELYIDAVDYTVRRVVYHDINNNLITIYFSDLRINISKSSEDFIFVTPKGVEEIRLP